MADEQLKQQVDQYVEEVWEDVVEDIRSLVKIESVEDLEAAEPGKPFGPKANEALVTAEGIASRLGLEVTDLDGYIGFGDVPGKSNTYIATIAHTDIVPLGLGWTFPALDVTRKDGYLIGRGVLDDKGPFVLSLYAANFFRRQVEETGEKLPYTIVVAKDEDPSRENRNMSLWYIPMDTPGVSTASLHKIGQQCIPFCEVYFDDVVVTEEQRMGKPGEGFMMLMKNFEVERSFIVAEQVGLAQAALEDAAKYANQRIAFGKPITKLQMIQEKLCDMEIKVQNTRNMLYKTLWKLDNGESVQLDSAMLKRYGCSECFQVADMALSIYAGLGYTTEVRIGRIWADLRGNMFGGGTHEVMAYIAGRQVAKKYAN